MSFESDMLLDRLRLRRKVTTWRVIAFLLALAGIAAAGVWAAGLERFAGASPHIARLTISGLITGSRETQRLIESIGKSKEVAAVIVVIDSPGGTTSGSEALHDQIRELAAKKPVVAVVNRVAASGGYIAAMGAERIFARGTSIVGSIGVIAQFPNVSKLLDNIGVQMETVRSTPLKAAPSGFEPTSPEARRALESTIRDSYDWFRAMVKERRKLADAELEAIADGRVFSGRQALPLKLIDAIGSEKDAIAWLEKEKRIAKDLPIRDWEQRRPFLSIPFLSQAGGAARALGLESLAQMIGGDDILPLDGLLSVWQPAGQN